MTPDSDRLAPEESWRKRLAVLQRASLSIVRLTDAEQIGAEMIQVLEQLLPYERGAIAIVDRERGDLRLLAHSTKGLTPAQFQEEFARIDSMIRDSPDEGVIRHTVATGTMTRIDDVQAHAGYLTGDSSIRSELCVPVIFAGRTIGAINVESFQPNAFDDDDAGLLTVLANQVALALENAWLSQFADAQTLLRDRAEKEAQAARHLLAEAIESLVDGFVLFDENRKLRVCNARVRTFYPRIAAVLNPGVSADQLAQVAHESGQFTGIGENGHSEKDVFLDVAGHDRSAQEFTTAEGRLIEVRKSRTRTGAQICLHIDITERRRIEQALAQAQKVEAIGRLTAGVAHDFNNILAVIMGNLELAEESIADTEVSGFLDESLKATRHGAHLTQQLLAFGRRSTLIPKVVDCNAIVSGMNQLLRRTLPAFIHVETVKTAGLWMIEVDPVQLETAILNLVVNARDAMPDGGTLTIETSNVRLEDDYCVSVAGVVKPGRYVVIAVSDTGTGMTPDIAAQVFEPFFTTKPIGKGTGLGLPMVFGFARQSGGNARVYSEVGRGTTVKLYFPQVSADAEQAGAVMSRAGGRTQGKGCILVVEDFEDVRNVVVGRLNRMGYDTIEAPDGDTALAMLRSGVKSDLLLADVVMPGSLQGPQLVETALAEYPFMKAVLMSGYAKSAMENGMAAIGNVEVMTKPISRKELETVIRRILEGDD